MAIVSITPTAAANPANTPAKPEGFWSADGQGVTFADLLDVLNPLQHVPVVGSVYRALTGDTVAPAAKLAGGALLGGPIGFASALVGNIWESVRGQEPVADAMTWVAQALGGPQGTGAENAALATVPAAARITDVDRLQAVLRLRASLETAEQTYATQGNTELQRKVQALLSALPQQRYEEASLRYQEAQLRSFAVSARIQAGLI